MTAPRDPVSLDGARLARLLAARGLSPRLSVVASTTSTNDDARADPAAPQGSLFLADQQTAGRGRQGRKWHSPPGRNLYMSLVWRPQVPARTLPRLSLVVGVVVARVVDEALEQRRASLKWPNDVYVDGAKIAGVLIESALEGDRPRCVVGVGLNVAGRSFPEGESYTVPPTSLELLGAEADRHELAASLIVELFEALELWTSQGLAPFFHEIEARDLLRGREVLVDRQPAVAAGIAADGSLLVDREGERAAVVAGEVRLAAAGSRPLGSVAGGHP